VKYIHRIGKGVVFTILSAILFAVPALADSFSSTNFKIDSSVATPFGGQSNSTNYKMVVSGGEATSGQESSSSYKIGHGYVAQLSQSIQLTLVENPVSLGTVIPGTSNTATLTANTLTDAPGYSLAISQNNDLTNGVTTIPPVGGSIAVPALWNEGSTKGLGFTQTTPANPSQWGSPGSYKYAAFPGSPTTFFTHSGFTGGAQNTVVLQPRLDVLSSQLSGAYANTVTLTATLIP